ncbi:hypothetical protein GTR04_3527 [Trichophyton interdigitale]|nr:hypothetical protein GY631_3319 [Trichophyton interdigitale]KAG8209068.1 hypothetical protein GTR04_3527 [Trichophyton interdigitale]
MRVVTALGLQSQGNFGRARSKSDLFALKLSYARSSRPGHEPAPSAHQTAGRRFYKAWQPNGGISDCSAEEEDAAIVVVVVVGTTRNGHFYSAASRDLQEVPTLTGRVLRYDFYETLRGILREGDHVGCIYFLGSKHGNSETHGHSAIRRGVLRRTLHASSLDGISYSYTRISLH